MSITPAHIHVATNAFAVQDHWGTVSTQEHSAAEQAPDAIAIRNTLPRLSSRETDVVRLVAEGKTDPEIAQLLGLSVNTVKTRLRRIRERWQCPSRVHMAVWSLQCGLTRLSDLPPLGPSGQALLTGHEAQVLALLSNNLTVKEVAEQLGTTTGAVHNAEQRIRSKWNAADRAEIIALGQRYLRALTDQRPQ